MQEVNGKQAQFIVNKKQHHLLFVNSPFCGTCKVAKRMLHYIEDTLEDEKFYELNATLAPEFMQEFNITSVPCLLVVKHGEAVERLYTFNSVPYLLKEMGPYLVKERTQQT
ncbi:thioredoxin family protein [Alkalibacillus salilacus]|uniref:Thiol-disulfide isomerase/thioredoxin n=1 Tax=Alkalibacillus salilacus TaxID=284582 RepID=A0ABT9VEY7_9BACI|nr:thioredoxin family protein [Alkalibacillus salilacus]MDQ0159536.1 thiol-disulfide isomerase/thioredoxin [Alkalibacillus salilacus]